MVALVLQVLWHSKYARAAGIFLAGLAAAGLAVGAFWLWLSMHDAAVAEAARKGYVTQVTLEAVQAKLKEQDRQRQAAETSLAEYRQRATDAIKARDEANAKLKAAIAADTGDGYTWTADDLKWLRDN